ncbi:MKRN2 opposite strand protein-like isoform X2 [Sebastes umbrosus]|uniref:MKRN2 opposite strand protein-like isoform X2 n=1 Tax=Sebastes umbrosus TaxID=72105 RepID=UPI00189D336E|nr:MKRN2 opposite strand protein-like isoform X2 [Sebastes umbrosus]
MDLPVIRLSHCQKEIFCFSVPEECPSCGEELRGSRLQEAPVSLPSPLSNGHKTSCCLLVAPAHDNHNREFDGTSDLHTGISNTSGVVYNYTRGGVSREQSGWERCVSVPLVRPDMFHLLAQWDQYLDRFSDGPMWDPAWHSVLAAEGRSSLSRETFTHSFILPRMRRVTKYTTLYRHIERHKYYMVDRQEDTQEDTPVTPGLL